MTQKHAMLLILYICLKFDVNTMHKTMERMCLSSPTSYVAIDIFDRHIFCYRHISVKFDGHHPMLMVCQTIEFAIVFFSFCIAWLINTWRYTYIKYGWNACEYNEENYANKVAIVISIVTFDSDILAFEFVFAIDIWDRLAFFLSSFLGR